MVSARSLIPLILGPTASGKSAAAMAVARRWPVEIISVDSAQVYRGLDIGTAKPSPAERAAVTHHLIDIVEPDDPYSAARFVGDAVAAMAQIRARERLPLLVGGTTLYVKALTEGLHDLPSADADLRRELDEQAQRLGWPAMHARLRELDPVSAARLEPGDSQRIQRALEVCLLSGQPMSALLAAGTRRPAMAGLINDDGEPVTLWPIVLEPTDRAVLHQRIEARFRAMIAAGLIDEVRALRAGGRFDPDLPALRSVGYRQVWAWLDAQAGPTPINTDAMIQQGIAATRQLAKRQLTWLRGMPGWPRIDCLRDDAADQVVDALGAVMR